MSWLAQLQPASFRGVHFHVDTIEHAAGDNVVLREYPFQDLPTMFRMGDGAEEIKFSAYVIGADYMQRRDALRLVLSGQGELVHPTAGTLLVFVNGKYKLTENPAAQGGMARFELTFVRAQERRYPVGVADTRSQARGAAVAAKTAATAVFAQSFNLGGLTGWVRERVAQNVKAAVGLVWNAVQTPGAGIAEHANKLVGNYQALAQNLDGLLSQPAALANQVGKLFAVPAELSRPQAQAFQNAHQSLFNLAPKLPQTDFEVSVMPPVGTGLVIYGAGKASALISASPQRIALATQTGATLEFIETMATAAYVEACAAVELQGYEQAMALRKAVNHQCTRLLVRSSARAAPEQYL